MSYPQDFGPPVDVGLLAASLSQDAKDAIGGTNWALSGGTIQMSFPAPETFNYRTSSGGGGSVTTTASAVAQLRNAYEALRPLTDWTPAAWAGGAVLVSWLFAWWAKRK